MESGMPIPRIGTPSLSQMRRPENASGLMVVVQLILLNAFILAIRKLALGIEGPLGTVLTIQGLLVDGLATAVLVAATIHLVRGVDEVLSLLQSIRAGDVLRYALLGGAIALAIQASAILLSWVDRGGRIPVFTGFNTWLALPGAVILASASSVFEECVFRGVALRLLCRKYRPILAAALQAGLFVAIHLPLGKLSAGGALTVALSGFLFALIVLATRSLWAAIAAHFAYNFVSACLFGSYLIRGWHDGLFTRNPASTGLSSASELLTFLPALMLAAIVSFYLHRNRPRLDERAA